MRTIPFIRNIRNEWAFFYPTFHNRLKLISLRVSHVASVHSAVQLHMLGAVQVPPFSHIGSHTAVEENACQQQRVIMQALGKYKIMVQPEFYIIILHQQMKTFMSMGACELSFSQPPTHNELFLLKTTLQT